MGHPGPANIELRLLGSFELLVGDEPKRLPVPSQRVLALLGLDPDRPVNRSYVAGTLWPDVTEVAARSDLRSALWELGSLRELVTDSTFHELRLRPGVRLDLQKSRDLARHVLDPTCDGAYASPDYFSVDLLPDWDDEWLHPERESYRQLRLHALEALSDRLVAAGRFGEAVEAGLMAMAAAPLRESAHRAVIRALVVEGNRGEALRLYQQLSDLLQDELGIEPSFRLDEVLTDSGNS